MRNLVPTLLLAAAQPTAGLSACEPTETALGLLSAPIEACASVFETEDALLASDCSSVDVEQVCRMARRGWWRAVKHTLPAVADDQRVPLRQFLEAHRAGAKDIVALLRAEGVRRYQQTGEDRTVIVPACQWAQSTSTVAVAVRYSPKRHGPVSVANVDDANVELTETHVSFTALARGKPLKFVLEVELEGRIDPTKSSWSASAAGRLTLTLAKAEAGTTWVRLAKPAAAGAPRLPPITTWHEMAEHFGVQPMAKADDDDDAPSAASKPAKAAGDAKKKKKQESDEAASGGSGGGGSGSASESKPSKGGSATGGSATGVRGAVLRWSRKARRWWRRLESSVAAVVRPYLEPVATALVAAAVLLLTRRALS